MVHALTATSPAPADNTELCPPGEIRINIPIESQEDIVIGWVEAPCEVSGYLVDLWELDGISSNLTSGICNGT